MPARAAVCRGPRSAACGFCPKPGHPAICTCRWFAMGISEFASRARNPAAMVCRLAPADMGPERASPFLDIPPPLARAVAAAGPCPVERVVRVRVRAEPRRSRLRPPGSSVQPRIVCWIGSSPWRTPVHRRLRKTDKTGLFGNCGAYWSGRGCSQIAERRPRAAQWARNRGSGDGSPRIVGGSSWDRLRAAAAKQLGGKTTGGVNVL